MRKNDSKQMLAKLVAEFGIERLLSALPQAEVRQALDLVSMHELAKSLGLHYDTMRSQMQAGKIPFPTIRLVRRAYFTRAEAKAIQRAWKNQAR